MTALEEEEERGVKKGRTLLVAVKVGVCSHQLLTWALVKAAQTSDQVIALHVVTNSELSSKQQSNTNHQATNFFNAAVEVYEGFCSLKQVALQFKITYGSSVRKVLIEEAKLHEATKLILGANKHKALGSPISLAKYCMKKLPCSTSVLVVENGKVIFERCGAQHLSVIASTPRIRLFNPIQWRIKCKNCKVLNNNAGNYLPVVECPLERTAATSPSSICSSSSHGEEESGSCTTLNPKVPKDVISGLHIQKGESPSGWPLLHRAVSFSKAPSPRSTARKISVVEWALQLPNRQAQMTEQFQVEAEIAHEVCNHEYKVQSSNGRTLIEAFSKEAGIPCNELDKSKTEEHSSMKKLEFLCKSSTCRKFTYQELQYATSDFSAENFIGSGGWSRVYRGFLPDEQSVAVKAMNCSTEAEQEFIMEVEILTSLKHNHIISLVGYCVEGYSRLLVYNFVSRGNLEENLHGGKDKPVLCWTERFKVAVGVAEALDYLHNGCSRSVIHRDVKSSNILLSEDFEPKLADFGLAKWASITSSYITCNDVLGTFGYLAPEYFVYGKVNDKTDVYAFGVVLLELITGRKPINTRYPKGQESLVMWAKPLLEEESTGKLIDQRLLDAYDTNEMQRMMLAAALCLTQASQYRPHISRILKILRGEDGLTDWAWRQHMMTKDRDVSDEDDHIENQGGIDIQTHFTLAMLGVDNDIVSMSSVDHSVDILQAEESFEDYLKGRCSRSSSFD